MLPALGSLPRRMLTPLSQHHTYHHHNNDKIKTTRTSIATTTRITKTVRTICMINDGTLMICLHAVVRFSGDPASMMVCLRAGSQCRAVSKSPSEPYANMPAHSSCSSPLSAPCCFWQPRPTAFHRLPAAGTTTGRIQHRRIPQRLMEDSLAPELTSILFEG